MGIYDKTQILGLIGCPVAQKCDPVPKTFLSPGSLQLRSRIEGVSELKQDVEVWEGPAQLTVSTNPITVRVPALQMRDRKR